MLQSLEKAGLGGRVSNLQKCSGMRYFVEYARTSAGETELDLPINGRCYMVIMLKQAFLSFGNFVPERTQSESGMKIATNQRNSAL
jgi:hypothetical protein